MKKIKILRIINRFNIGGPTYNATFLTKFLGDEYETKLVGGLPDVGESDSLYILEKYDVEPILLEEMIRLPSISSDRKAYLKLKEIIKEYQPDIVHTHASKAGALGRKAARACNVPIVIHTFHGHVFHSYFGKVKTNLFKAIERNLSKKSDAIVAISDIQKGELVNTHKICKADKIHVIPLGFDLEPFHQKRINSRISERAKWKLAEEDVAIAIVGRLAPVKNHSFFFDVITEVLSKTTKSVKVFVVGDGAEREKIALRAKEINELHNNRIALTSWISDIGEFNSAMDIVCLTSNNEGTPVSLIEAQAGGIPVVSTDVGGVRDIVLNGDTGFVVAINDQESFVNCVLELIEDENKREKMSQNGWTFVQDKFHYKTLARNMDILYKDLLQKKK
ncbi:MAG: glycosyltransferase involved in cell wall biosynthesis [Salibacteraceae bacterium]